MKIYPFEEDRFFRQPYFMSRAQFYFLKPIQQFITQNSRISSHAPLQRTSNHKRKLMQFLCKFKCSKQLQNDWSTNVVGICAHCHNDRLLWNVFLKQFKKYIINLHDHQNFKRLLCTRNGRTKPHNYCWIASQRDPFD